MQDERQPREKTTNLEEGIRESLGLQNLKRTREGYSRGPDIKTERAWGLCQQENQSGILTSKRRRCQSLQKGEVRPMYLMKRDEWEKKTRLGNTEIEVCPDEGARDTA